MILPVRVERIIAELGHECSERKSDNSCAICGKPVMNREIFDPGQNKCDLFISRNWFHLMTAGLTFPLVKISAFPLVLSTVAVPDIFGGMYVCVSWLKESEERWKDVQCIWWLTVCVFWGHVTGARPCRIGSWWTTAVACVKHEDTGAVGDECMESEDNDDSMDSEDGSDELGGTGTWPSTMVDSYLVTKG